LDLRHLPEARLEGIIDLDRRNAGFDADIRGNTVEVRTSNRIEMREAEDGSPLLVGYASVYDFPYPIAGGPPHGWTEVIARHAAKRSIDHRDDVQLFFNHDGLPLARTSAGSLVLKSDEMGLRTEAKMDRSSPYSMEIISRLQRGELHEMSFAFEVKRQRWENEDGTEGEANTAPVRRIQEVKLYDVSVVSFPANPATAVQMNSARRPADALSVAEADEMLAAFRRA
jgi:HK97 family phage prohead protease